jgi:hypothetical protein
VLLPLRLTAIQVALCAVATYPVLRFAGRDGLDSMLLGAVLSWFAVVASYVALLVAFRNVKPFAVVIVLGGFLLRLAVLFGLLAWIARTWTVNLGQVVIWLVSFYLVLVIAEAWILAQAEIARAKE